MIVNNHVLDATTLAFSREMLRKVVLIEEVFEILSLIFGPIPYKASGGQIVEATLASSRFLVKGFCETLVLQ